MMVTLTNALTKRQFLLRYDFIWVVEPSGDGAIFYRVATTTVGQKGFISYEVMESMEEINAAIDAAIDKVNGREPKPQHSKVGGKPESVIAS